MSEDIADTVARLEELTTADNPKQRLFGYEVVAGLLPHVRQAISARATIAELEKRVGELEATLTEYKTAVSDFEDENDRLEQALTIERQRREEAEAGALALRKNFAVYLVPAYIENRCLIAALCDEQLDRRGELLGYVREAANRAPTDRRGG